MLPNFSFGSDPEFMLVNEKGQYKSAIEVLGYSKEDKLDLGNGHKAFYDNVLVEVNIATGNTVEEVISNFRDCFSRLAKVVGAKHRLVPQASQIYPKQECEHPDALVFGCDPEYCIHELDDNGKIKKMEPPVCNPGNTFRSGGGHVHIGHQLANIYEGGQPVELAHMMDLFLGTLSLLIDHDPTSAKRRALYGGAGTIRIQASYGMEYRTLSNFWLASPNLVRVVHGLCQVCLEMVNSGDYKLLQKKFPSPDVRKTINSGNKQSAKEMYSTLKNYLPLSLNKTIEDRSKPASYDFYTEWEMN